MNSEAFSFLSRSPPGQSVVPHLHQRTNGLAANPIDLIFVELLVVGLFEPPGFARHPVTAIHTEGQAVILQQVDLGVLHGNQIGLEIREKIRMGKAADDGLEGRTDQLDHRVLTERFPLIDEEWDVVVLEVRANVLLILAQIRGHDRDVAVSVSLVLDQREDLAADKLDLQPQTRGRHEADVSLSLGFARAESEHVLLHMRQGRALREPADVIENERLGHFDFRLGESLEHVAIGACRGLEESRPGRGPIVRHADSDVARIDAESHVGLIDGLEHLDQQGHLAARERRETIHPEPGPLNDRRLADGPTRRVDLRIRIDEFVPQGLGVLAKDQADIGEFQSREARFELEGLAAKRLSSAGRPPSSVRRPPF